MKTATPNSGRFFSVAHYLARNRFAQIASVPCSEGTFGAAGQMLGGQADVKDRHPIPLGVFSPVLRSSASMTQSLRACLLVGLIRERLP